MKKVSAREKWKRVVSHVRACEDHLRDLYNDGDTEEAMRKEDQMINIFMAAYDITFKSGVRPNWFFEKDGKSKDLPGGGKSRRGKGGNKRPLQG